MTSNNIPTAFTIAQPTDVPLTIVQIPSDVDVLCGRGKPIQHHPGNRRFLRIVEVHREKYQNAKSRAEKKVITNGIIREIRMAGGHFLQINKQTGTYYDVGDDVARDKVAHALRSRKNIQPEPMAPAQAVHQNVLFNAQQNIFQTLVRTDDGMEHHEEEQPPPIPEQPQSSSAAEVNNSMFVEETVSGQFDDAESDTTILAQCRQTREFNGLLQRQQVIFRDLVVSDDDMGDG